MKLIKDTIHGYIKIPDEYCRHLIDTEVFQRLRRIEQTSIRSLFPCAHHDRFVHSLGTYHLGSKAIGEIFNNSTEVIGEIKKEHGFEKKDLKTLLKTLKETFEIACLLHDSGHAPFSHTFECHFDRANDLKALLLKHSTDKNLSDDIDLLDIDSKPHERVSAYLVLTYFKEKIQAINPDIDINLIVRMILGCGYKKDKSLLNQLKNCLIKLLNDNIIDVDKLDYAARDRWASGYSASSVDMERLLLSFQICKKDNEYVRCIKKNAVSEIDGLIDSANFQSFWIFNHHKVVYEQHLLAEALNLLPKHINSSDPDSVFKQMFNVNVLTSKQDINGHIVFQLTDDDIIYLLKQYHELNPYFQEWISRQYKLKPLWKSYSEYFSLFFRKIKSDSPERLTKKVKTIVKGVFEENGCHEDSFYIGMVKQKLKQVERNNLFIKIDDSEPLDYCDLEISKQENAIKPYFYVYVKEECLFLKKCIIAAIQNQLS
jgi:HD superfamily phosphohydrolase